MRRWLTLLLLIMLPLQANWAALSAYAQHEQGEALFHLGYHLDPHQSMVRDNNAGTPSAGASHENCGCCHICILSLPAEGGVKLYAAVPNLWPDASAPALLFQPTAPPERPDRLSPFPFG